MKEKLISRWGLLRMLIKPSFYIYILIIFFTHSSLLFCQDSKEQNQKTSTQQIGGLLFDVDEGVKVEQGPGGSVYVKSNREFMQQKFASIEARLAAIDNRLSKLEEFVGTASPSPAPSSDSAQGRKVLVT